MDKDIWVGRIKGRIDTVARLTHLTRSQGELSAFDVLVKILEEKKIIGSTTATGYICGTTPAVCLQEIPLGALAETIAFEEKLNEETPRYEPYGIRFNKPFIYKKGGRPVIYEKTEVMKEFLPDSQYWRIVNLNLEDGEHIVDWTHEREWRVPNFLEFEYKNIEIILPNRNARKKLFEYCEENNKMEIVKEVFSIINMNSIVY